MSRRFATIAALAVVACQSKPATQDSTLGQTAAGQTTAMQSGPPASTASTSPLPSPATSTATPRATAPVTSNDDRQSTATVARKDTAFGVVSVAGSDPGTWVQLAPASGAALRLSGAAAAALRNVSGAEVWVSGARSASGFRVDEFVVRRANGVPVDDGTIEIAGEVVRLHMRSGATRDVPNATAGLRRLAGARVWVTRPEANRAPTFGLIARP